MKEFTLKVISRLKRRFTTCYAIADRKVEEMFSQLNFKTHTR